jgi:hypothetical protein
MAASFLVGPVLGKVTVEHAVDEGGRPISRDKVPGLFKPPL